MQSTDDLLDQLRRAPLLEGVVTTINDADQTNIAAMGPRVAEDFSAILLRPFEGTATLANLVARGCGVLHVTDDVMLIASAALDHWPAGPPALVDVPNSACRRLADCCRWYAFDVIDMHQRSPRSEVICRVRSNATLREFFGFNRAKHAVIEAAILATRLHLIDAQAVTSEFERLATIVDKTAGPREFAAMELVHTIVQQRSNGAECEGQR